MKLIMSEMLGNQYFIARRYQEACFELEASVQKDPFNYSAIKKLIICYLQTDQFDKAFKYFIEIVRNDLSVITNTDLHRDGCPCPEIIERTLPELNYTTDDEQFIKLGILYLYCDINESINYLEKVSPSSSLFKEVQEIISIEKAQLLKIN